MAKGRSRDRAKERLWRRHVRAQQAGGQSVRGYCRGRHLSEAGFYWWRQELARRAGVRRDVRALASAEPSAQPGSAPQAGESRGVESGELAQRATKRRGPQSPEEVVPHPVRRGDPVGCRTRVGDPSDTGTGNDRIVCNRRSGRARVGNRSNTPVRTVPRFSEVKVMGEERSAASGGAEAPGPGVEVCLHGGRTIRVGRRFDGATFLRVVALLEGGRRC